MPNLKISQFTDLAGAQASDDIIPIVVNAAAPNYYTTLDDLFGDLSLNTATGQIAINSAALSVDGAAGLKVTATASVPADSLIQSGYFVLNAGNGTASGSDGFYAALQGAVSLTATANLPDNIGGVVGSAQQNALSGTLATANAFYGYLATSGAGTMTRGVVFHATDAIKGVGTTITTQYGLFIDSLTAGSTNIAIKTNVGAVQLGDTVTIGGQATASELRLLEPSGSGTNYTGFKAPALAGDVVYTMPTADGTSGQVLQTNGSKVLSWATVAATPGGNPGDLQYNNAGAFAGVSGSSVSGSALTLGGALTVSISASSIATFTSSSSAEAPRVVVNSTGQANAGIELRESSVKKWSIATYSGGIFTFYNESLGAEAIGITAANVINLQGLTGVNKASPGGQLHTVSGSSSRISGLFEAAASNSAAVLVSKSGSSGTGDFWQGQNSSATVLAGFKSSGLAYFDATFTAGGTTGNQTINKPVGSVNFAAAATAITVTNSLVTTSSVILCELQTNDATARIANVVPASGSFTINLSAAATAETRVAFVVINN